MGMFDTIVLDRAYECPACGKEIESVQTKEFERTLEDYRVGDCISHAEDIRIVKETLYCEAMRGVAGGACLFCGESRNRAIHLTLVTTRCSVQGWLILIDILLAVKIILEQCKSLIHGSLLRPHAWIF